MKDKENDHKSSICAEERSNGMSLENFRMSDWEGIGHSGKRLGKKLMKQKWISLPRFHLREDRMNDNEKCRLKGSFLSMAVSSFENKTLTF